MKNFIDEYFLNENGYIELNKNINIPKHVSVHEAGHALYIYKYTKTMKFGGVICNGMEGNTFNSFIEDYDNLNTRTEKVEVALSGLVAEEVIYKKHDIGSSNDLEKASDLDETLESMVPAKYLPKIKKVTNLNDYILVGLQFICKEVLKNNFINKK